ncbi:MAG TPA: nuclear transport factor 2 family protein [Gemmatimonadaceae bacterium]|nr:nuclear transport factor 2 family protein [Gemmatimonadaceae bacterium]
MRPFLTFLVAMAMAPVALRAQTQQSNARAEIDSFNREFADATRRMDNVATMTLWAEEGVSLLPSTKPIQGKAAIAAFIDNVTAAFPGARMERFDFECHDIEVSGDWASEWCTEHQIVHFADARPPFDGWGKLLLVLHRSSSGKWQIKTEMWNQAVPADTAKAR